MPSFFPEVPVILAIQLTPLQPVTAKTRAFQISRLSNNNICMLNIRPRKAAKYSLWAQEVSDCINPEKSVRRNGRI